MTNNETILNKVDIAINDAWEEGFSMGIDSIYDEARDEGFNMGFDESDEQNAKIIDDLENQITDLELENIMLQEEVETTYNEGFEDGADEQKAISERLRWEEIDDAVIDA